MFVVSYNGFLLAFNRFYNEDTARKRKLSAVIFAAGILTLALLQSIRQLSGKDLIIISVLVISLTFYLRRIEFK